MPEKTTQATTKDSVRPSELTKETVVEVMRGERFVMLTTVAEDGSLQSHPMSPQQVTEDADVRFFVNLGTELVAQLRAHPEANLAFAEAGSWLSVSGRAVFEEDEALKDELWNEGVSSWFDGGRQDPNLGLLRFESDSAQFWGQPGGKVRALVSVLAAKAKGERPAGQSGKIDL